MGLELYYNFDNDTATGGGIADLSGNGRNGSPNDADGGGIALGFSTDVPTAIGTGSSLDMTGTDDYVRAESPGYQGVVGTTDRTVAAWIRPGATSNQVIAEWGTQSTGQRWTFRLNESSGNALRVEVQGGKVIGTTTLSDGQWHHVAATFANDGTPDVEDVQLYVDGVLESYSSDLTPQSLNTVANVDVGVGNGQLLGQTRGIDGKLDELAIWSRSLQPWEIAGLAAGDFGPANIPSVLFEADFDAATLDPGTGGTPATDALVEEGTAIGSWTVDNLAGSEIVRNTAYAGDQVLKLDQNSPDYTAELSMPGSLGTTTAFFDLALRRFNIQGISDRDPLITALDSLGNELLTLTVSAADGSDEQRLGYISGGTTTWLGTAGDIANIGSDGDANLSELRTVRLDLDASTFSISLDDTVLASGIGYETAGVANLAEIRFFGEQPAGYYVDNMLVYGAVPEPASALLLIVGALGMLFRRRRRG